MILTKGDFTGRMWIRLSVRSCFLPDEDGDDTSRRRKILVGPYELARFFPVSYVMRFGVGPSKSYSYLANVAFAKEYMPCCNDHEMVKSTLPRTTSCNQQFKRSCLPDGPKVGSVAVSPRGDLRMPSDASPAVWMEKLDRIKEANGFE